MATVHPPPGVTGPSLDVQVLQGLETYITTEKFLHTLEAASAEWIDLSDHQQHPHKGVISPELELPEVQQQIPAGDVAEIPQPSGSSTPEQQSTSSSSQNGGIFSRWRRPAASAAGSTPDAVAAADQAAAAAAAAITEAAPSSSEAAPDSSTHAGSSDLVYADAAMPAVVAATTTFELVEPQAPLTESLMQEPFVLVSTEDAIEGMAYYIALYLSRAPEARYMEPKQLQAALRQTFTAIRRSRYRVIWDWGRCFYRWGAVSYSALQLYEHPWLVRAVVAGVWASSKMAFGVLI